MEEPAPEALGPNEQGPFNDLPAGYQQVMSPSGGTARVIGPHTDDDRRPNGVDRAAREIPATEPDYDRALRATGIGATGVTGQGTPTTHGFSGVAGRLREGGDADIGASSAGTHGGLEGVLTASNRPEAVGPCEQGGRERSDGLLFRGGSRAAATTGSDFGFMWPSPLPSPATRSINGDEQVPTTSGNVIAQQGAAAMKWLSKLGDFVQRRVAQQTRPGEQTTVVQETVWSPGHGTRTETEPLFDRSQSRRLRDMALAAPQLYGTVQRSGGGSDSSRSFTKEQLETEVRRQVEQAMEEQRSVSEENQRLRLEVERLRAMAAQGVSSGTMMPGPNEAPRLRDVYVQEQVEYINQRLEGNLTGLPGHSREQGGANENVERVSDPRGNPGVLWEHDGGQGGDRALSTHGVSRGNPPGLLGHESRQAREHAPEPQALNVPGGNPEGLPRRDGRWGDQSSSNRGVLGGNLSGLPGHSREQGGVGRARSQIPPRSNLLGFAGFYGKSEGHEVRPGPTASTSQGAAGKERSAGFQSDSVFGGNLAGLPGHSREQGGRVFSDKPGIYSGPYENVPGIYSGPPPGLSGEHQGVPGGGAPGDQPGPSVGGAGNPLEALVQGMTQLQAAMAMQMGMNAAKPETIRPGTTASELPKLSEADEMAAINVGDWLHGLSGPMGDLTDGSATWWSQVLMCLEAYYKDYVNASAVKKLQLRADDYANATLKEAKWLRVDKRAASMLLQSIPEAIRTEVLANRLQTTLSILARILTIYRPGSSVERQQVLKALEQPGSASTPMELVEALRRWARWLKRAQDLGLQVPDPSILLRGLDQASKAQLERHGEVAFRTNMLRYGLELDSAPSLPSVMKYQSHLLGEFEQIAYRGRSKGTTSTAPAVRAVGAGGNDGGNASPGKGASSPASSSTTTTTKPCKFFISESGCQRANCKFGHEWASIPREERHERCRNCGAKGHMKKSCPLRTGTGDPPRRDEGKGGQPPRLRPLGKGSDGKRDDGTVPTTTASTTATTGGPGAASSGSASTGASMDSSSTAGSSAAGVTGEAPAGARDVDDFLRNATQVLKLMTEQHVGSRPGPSMKMLKKVIKDYEGKMALVDSGATHPLRTASSEEWGVAGEVDVVVAGDGVKRMRQNDTGTLLMEPATTRAQTILPVGSLVAVLGYELVWTKKKCVLRAPDGKELALKVSSGCPEVSEATALELIAKIEQEKLAQLSENVENTKQAMLRAREVELDPCWEKSVREYVAKGKFEDGFRAMAAAPWATEELREDLARIITDLPTGEKEAWELMQMLGFNRRMRKRLMSKDWVVKMCSGRRSSVDKVFKAVESNGTVVLDIDVQRLPLLDILKAGHSVMKLLLWGAATGRVAAVLSGLPRHNALEHTLRAVVLSEVATAGRAAMCAEVDVPLDGVAFSLWASSESEQDESSLAWVFKWFRRWIAERHMDVHHFDQGGLGHPMRRPTTMATNLDVAELKGVQDARADEGHAGSWSSWAPMMVRVLTRGLKRWKQRPGWHPRLVRALKAVDRRAWERHLANDHVPYRPDCLQCIHNATGRPHRKCLHRDCYVLSADTLGPVRVPGVKGERYAVVFTYQFPKQKLIPEDQPIPDDELDGWDLDAREVELGKNTVDEEECDYSPDEGPDPQLSPEEESELRRVQRERPMELLEQVGNVSPAAKAAKKKEVSDDWWEFRESTGVLVRHHVTPRMSLFRPTSWNGCPVPPSKLDYTRVTEVKYVSGGVDTETSDWHGPQSGSRVLEKLWTGRTMFRISTAEVPEDEEELKKDEETWEKLIGDLTKPVEMDTIYMVYPVRARRGGDAMLAVQEAVLRLKLFGLPVARLHSDRGSEFASKGLRKWLLGHDIYHTRSEALVPQTNGAAERGVRWFKTMAKVLMAEAKVGLKYWTLAMQHAANRRMYERLGLSKPRLLPFGSKVMIRRKVFGNNKKYDLTDRWEEGTYLGLSDSIKGGAIVLRASGVLTETLNLKTDVVDPHALLAAPKEGDGDDGGGVGEIPVGEVPVVDLPEPDHRLTGKQPPPLMRMLKPTAGNPDAVPSGWTMRTLVKEQEDRARHYYNMGKFDGDSCAEVLRDVHLGGKAKRKTRGAQTSALVLGGYVHGGMRGATDVTYRQSGHLCKDLPVRLCKGLGAAVWRVQREVSATGQAKPSFFMWNPARASQGDESSGYLACLASERHEVRTFQNLLFQAAKAHFGGSERALVHRSQDGASPLRFLGSAFKHLRANKRLDTSTGDQPERTGANATSLAPRPTKTYFSRLQKCVFDGAVFSPRSML
ncbi:TY4B-J [Symbiodinium sp. CCMP2592]|nr:TY4B-J [Symbiodinium sp. CCMP2592]